MDSVITLMLDGVTLQPEMCRHKIISHSVNRDAQLRLCTNQTNHPFGTGCSSTPPNERRSQPIDRKTERREK